MSTTTVTLATEPREGRGSRVAARLRKAGKLPAIVYGHKETPVAITVDAEALNKAIRVQHVRVLDLTIGGKTEKVLIRELQWDYLGSHMIHADFERVSADEKVKVVIPVKLKNSPKTMGGGVIDQPMHALHIECPAIAIPEEHVIDIFTLLIGHPIHVSDLKLPEGVTVLDAADMVVVQLKLPGAGDAAILEAAAANVNVVEPEVIKKDKKAADEE